MSVTTIIRHISEGLCTEADILDQKPHLHFYVTTEFHYTMYKVKLALVQNLRLTKIIFVDQDQP